jgi:hypothetical protein
MRIRNREAYLGVCFLLFVNCLDTSNAQQRSATSIWQTNNGFEVSVLTSDTEELIRNACQKIRPFDNGSYMSCYSSGWAAWVNYCRRVVVPTSERKQFNAFLSGPGILDDAATSYVIFPDGTKHLIWIEVDKFGGGLVYFLVDPAKHDLDVIWLRKEVTQCTLARMLTSCRSGNWVIG